MNKPLKVIYACPFAHYSGHHPHASTVEPEILAKAGVDVSLVTFCGITNDPKLSIPHHQAIPNNWLVLQWVRHSTIPRWFLMVGETVATLVKAMRLYRRLKCDAIYLRDGEPFLFIAHLLSVPFRGYRWIVSLTGVNLFVPKPSMFKFRENPFIYFYTLALYVVSGAMWRPLYQLSMLRNKFVFITQNEEAREGYEAHQGGVFAGKVRCIPLGISNSPSIVSKAYARGKLGLPQDKTILLSFGAPHSGKNIEIVVKAVKEVPSVFIVHTGTQAFSLGSNPKRLTEEYGLGDRTAIFDYYVKEEEKPLFFAAADVLILSYTKVFKSTSSMLWETAKYKLPVISSDANTLGEMVWEYNLGLLFEAENTDSLVDAIRRFEALRSAELKTIRAGGERFVGDYSYSKWFEGLVKVFEEIIK